MAELLEGKEKALSLDLGTLLAENLSQNCSENRKTATIIAEADSCAVVPMLDFEKEEALRMSIALAGKDAGLFAKSDPSEKCCWQVRTALPS